MVLTKGNGTIPKLSDAVKVNYECKLIDGTVVDASANYGGAMQFNVAEVMPGWQEALQLMPNGSKYRLFILRHWPMATELLVIKLKLAKH